MGRFLSDSEAWGIMQSHASSLQHQSLQNSLLLQPYWYFSCSVHVSYYWAYSNSRKVCSFIFIVPTMENYFSYNFGPFTLFIISWLFMNHPLYLCHLKEFIAGAYFLQFYFFMICLKVNIFPGPLMSPSWVGQSSYRLHLVFFLTLTWTLKICAVFLYGTLETDFFGFRGRNLPIETTETENKPIWWGTW